MEVFLGVVCILVQMLILYIILFAFTIENGKDRRCKYEDGDEEDLSLTELKALASNELSLMKSPQPEQVLSSDPAKFKEDDYDQLYKRYLTPQVRENVELPNGMYLRRQYKERYIDKPSARFNKLRLKIDSLLKIDDRAEIYKTLRQLRDYDINPKRVGLWRDLGVDDDDMSDVNEFVDLTTDPDKFCVDLENVDDDMKPACVESFCKIAHVRHAPIFTPQCYDVKSYKGTNNEHDNEIVRLCVPVMKPDQVKSASVTDGSECGGENVEMKRSTGVIITTNKAGNDNSEANIKKNISCKTAKDSKSALSKEVQSVNPSKSLAAERSLLSELNSKEDKSLLLKEIDVIIRLHDYQTIDINTPIKALLRISREEIDVNIRLEQKIINNTPMKAFLSTPMLSCPIDSSLHMKSNDEEKQLGDRNFERKKSDSKKSSKPDFVGSAPQSPSTIRLNSRAHKSIRKYLSGYTRSIWNYDYQVLKRQYLTRRTRMKHQLAIGITLRKQCGDRFIDQPSPMLKKLKEKMDPLLKKRKHKELYVILCHLHEWNNDPSKDEVWQRLGIDADIEDEQLIDLTNDDEDNHIVNMDTGEDEAKQVVGPVGSHKLELATGEDTLTKVAPKNSEVFGIDSRASQYCNDTPTATVRDEREYVTIEKDTLTKVVLQHSDNREIDFQTPQCCSVKPNGIANSPADVKHGDCQVDQCNVVSSDGIKKNKPNITESLHVQPETLSLEIEVKHDLKQDQSESISSVSDVSGYNYDPQMPNATKKVRHGLQLLATTAQAYGKSKKVPFNEHELKNNATAVDQELADGWRTQGRKRRRGEWTPMGHTTGRWKGDELLCQ